MPGNLMDAEPFFPDIRGLDQDAINQQIVEYLRALREQFRYTLGNLGRRNFNRNELTHLTDGISEPLDRRLSALQGQASALAASVQGLASGASDTREELLALGNRVEELAAELEALTAFLETPEDGGPVRPVGEWDFSQATVTGLDTNGGQ